MAPRDDTLDLSCGYSARCICPIGPSRRSWRARAQLKASLMMALESCFAQSEELAVRF